MFFKWWISRYSYKTSWHRYNKDDNDVKLKGFFFNKGEFIQSCKTLLGETPWLHVATPRSSRNIGGEKNCLSKICFKSFHMVSFEGFPSLNMSRQNTDDCLKFFKSWWTSCCGWCFWLSVRAELSLYVTCCSSSTKHLHLPANLKHMHTHLS